MIPPVIKIIDKWEELMTKGLSDEDKEKLKDILEEITVYVIEKSEVRDDR